jgi:hypothetical protein
LVIPSATTASLQPAHQVIYLQQPERRSTNSRCHPHQRQLLATSNASPPPSPASILEASSAILKRQSISRISRHWILKRSEGLKRDRRDGPTHHGAFRIPARPSTGPRNRTAIPRGCQGRFSNLAVIPNILEDEQGVILSRVRLKSPIQQPCPPNSRLAARTCSPPIQDHNHALEKKVKNVIAFYLSSFLSFLLSFFLYNPHLGLVSTHNTA